MFICIKSSTVCDKNTTQPNYLQKIPAARSCRHRGHAGEMATEVKYSVLTMLMGEAGPLNTPQVTHTHTHTRRAAAQIRPDRCWNVRQTLHVFLHNNKSVWQNMCKRWAPHPPGVRRDGKNDTNEVTADSQQESNVRALDVELKKRG